MRIIPPLKPQFKIDEQGDVKQQILERVNSEDNFTDCRGYPLIKSEFITGKLGRAMIELIPKELAISKYSLKRRLIPLNNIK